MCILALFSKLNVVCLVLSGPKGTSFFSCSRYSRSLARLQTHKHRDESADIHQQKSETAPTQTDSTRAEGQKHKLFLLLCDCHAILLRWKTCTKATEYYMHKVRAPRVWFQMWLWVCETRGAACSAGSVLTQVCRRSSKPLSDPCQGLHPCLQHKQAHAQQNAELVHKRVSTCSAPPPAADPHFWQHNFPINKM